MIIVYCVNECALFALRFFVREERISYCPLFRHEDKFASCVMEEIKWIKKR